MKNLTCILMAASALARVCAAQEGAAVPPAPPSLAAVKQPGPNTVAPVFSEPTKVYLGGTNPVLNSQELAGVAMTETWAQKSFSAMDAKPGPNGAIVFRYGESLPTIVCAALHVTDIELEPGELVAEKGLQWGDTVRWTVDASLSSPGLTGVEHIIVKPLEIGIETSLVIVTDRRTYNLQLISTEQQYFHRVAFSYTDEPAVRPVVAPGPGNPKSDAPAVRVALEEPARVRGAAEGKGVAAPEAGETAGYRISGKAPWKPVSVYSRGEKTFIRMPAHVHEEPALFELTKGGFLGLGNSKNLVNYRIEGRTYVVDSVLDRAVMVVGVGSGQTKVTLTRKN